MNLKCPGIVKFCLIIALLLVFCPDYAHAQSFIFPLDNGGYATIKIDHNTVYIMGIVLGDDVPRWEDLVSWEGPPCAIMNIYSWNCENPQRYGSISTSFSYRLNIFYPKGCKDQVCFNIIDHPEYGEICIDDNIGNIAICVDILDPCGNPMWDRDHIPHNFVDMDETVVFFAELSSPNEDAVFPGILAGEVDGCGPVYGNIQMLMTYNEPGYAAYISDPYAVRDFLTGCSNGRLLFRISGANDYYESVYADQVKIKIDRELNFIGNVEIRGTTMPNTVCYPGNSFLSFGVDVTMEPRGWPFPCGTTNISIRGFMAGDRIITTSGEAVAGGFTTEPAQSTYEIVPYQWETFNLTWTASVSGGPEREAKPLSTTIRVYHGFKAEDIIVPNPPSGDTLFCSNDPADYLDLSADPTPFLVYQDRIKYKWIVTPLDPPGQGSFPDGDELGIRNNRFRADYPGDVQIQYKIRDVDTGYESELSDPITLHLAPTITITSPSYFDKFTFNTDDPGILDIPATAQVYPEQLAGELIWEIELINESDLTITPNPPSSVNFIFEKLPKKNDQFGEKKIKASLPQWNVADSVDEVLVFYDKYADNHPDSMVGPIIIPMPNWYYYWEQTSAHIVGLHYYGGTDCLNNPNAYGTWWFDKWYNADLEFYICDRVGTHTFRPPLPFGGQYEGIDCFGIVLLHENEHRDNWWASWCPNCPYDIVLDDPDKDYIPTEREDELYGTDPLNPATYGLPDKEYIAYCVGDTWQIGSADSEDWANPGHNY